MKTLVTGANGFLGSAIMWRLLEAGHEMRVLVRAQSGTRNLNNFLVEICEGDLRDTSSIKCAASDFDKLLHVVLDSGQSRSVGTFPKISSNR
jgi:dihydroflavonol-4-reductase